MAVPEKIKQGIARGLEAFLIPGGFTRIVSQTRRKSLGNDRIENRVGDYINYSMSSLLDGAKLAGWAYVAYRIYESFS